MGKSIQRRKRDTVPVLLVSTAGTGFSYTIRKNLKHKDMEKRTKKLEFRKYDPRIRQHVLFKEKKLK